ncbi:zinc finger protein 821-like [Parasteatoda tepidariorum]|uniref:zinc finger protein 821-like n=1 Tax=Parasteatoda tepidariorum TaxID=114398 RepID=UPI0039BC7641
MPPKQIALSRSTSQACKKRTTRVSETLEQRGKRLATKREHNAFARSLETSEQQEKRLLTNQLRITQARSLETSEQQERRLLTNQLRTIQARSSETSEQRDARMKINQERTSLFRRCQYSDLNLSEFHYDPTTNYSNPSVIIGKMNQLCMFCSALKFKLEFAVLETK